LFSFAAISFLATFSHLRSYFMAAISTDGGYKIFFIIIAQEPA